MSSAPDALGGDVSGAARRSGRRLILALGRGLVMVPGRPSRTGDPGATSGSAGGGQPASAGTGARTPGRAGQGVLLVDRPWFPSDNIRNHVILYRCVSCLHRWGNLVLGKRRAPAERLDRRAQPPPRPDDRTPLAWRAAPTTRSVTPSRLVGGDSFQYAGEGELGGHAARPAAPAHLHPARRQRLAARQAAPRRERPDR